MQTGIGAVTVKAPRVRDRNGELRSSSSILPRALGTAQVRMEEANQCILVVMGATAEGKKELVALTDGFRESAQSWKDVLLDMKRRGLQYDPQDRGREVNLRGLAQRLTR